MRKLIELLVIAMVMVFATVLINTAFASCLDVASTYQAAAAMRDAGVAPRNALERLHAYPNVTEQERRAAVINAWRHGYQSSASAYRAGLTHCKGV